MYDLDFRTAGIIYFCSHVCLAVLLAVALSDNRAKGARLWLAGLATQIVSAPLFALRGHIGDGLSIIVANLIFTLSWSCYWASFEVFFGKRRPVWVYALPLGPALLIFTVFLHEPRLRLFFASLLYVTQISLIAAVILARRREHDRGVLVMLGAGYLLAALAFVVRLWMAVTTPRPDIFTPGPETNAFLLLSVPSLAACTLGFVLLHRDRAEQELRRLADLDPLTGLRNRRGFEAAFARALRTMEQTDGWLSVALVDLDHFKAVNDGCGHAVGDAVLRRLALILAGEVRDSDVVARIGGDEFCVLLGGLPPKRAGAVAERLRRAVAGHDWRSQGCATPLTVTIGLSSRQGGAAGGGTDFLERADRALLAAKGMARDMVLHADALSGVSSTLDA